MTTSAKQLVTDTITRKPATDDSRKPAAHKAISKSTKCGDPVDGIVRMKDAEGTLIEVPACGAHITSLRERSAKAGKMKTLPKGMTKAQEAQFTGRNQDDLDPIEVRPLTEVEKENEPRCLVHHLAED